MVPSLLAHLARRLIAAALLVFGIATATFLLIHAAPGDPADLYLSKEMDPATRRAILSAYGLDQPLARQYWRWISGLATGELGWSIVHRRHVSEVILERIPRTLRLTIPAFALHLALGIGIGLLAARRRGGIADALASGGALAFYSIPSFWLGALLIMYFSLHLGWLPSSGMRDLIAAPSTAWGSLLDQARHLVLPVICLGVGSAACTARFVRSGILSAMHEGYAGAARARGASESRVLARHALGNAILPVITLAGLSVPFLLSGSVMVESVFSWPGMGSLSVEAVFARDYPVALACQILLASAVVAGNLAADVGLALADPRLRRGARS